jgi:hypothetical protein
MPNKISTAKVILQIMGWLDIICAAGLFFIFLFGSVILGITVEKHAFLASIILGGIGLGISIMYIIFGVLYLITAKGITNKKSWAKIVGIILGILALPGVPIGTVLGIFILIGLLSPEANTWFTE